MATPPNAVAMAAAPPVEVEPGALVPPFPPDVVAAGPPVVPAPLETVVSLDSPEVLAPVVVPAEVVPAEVVPAALLRSEVVVEVVVLCSAVDSELLEPLAVLPVADAEPDSVAE